MKNIISDGNRVGLFLALLFLFCFVWHWVNPVHQQLHRQLLELSFIGFSGMNLFSFVCGLLQSYVWGFLAVALWYLVNLGKTRA